MSGIRQAVVRAWGHELVRSTHAKTLELTGDAEISERATCVVGVGAELAAGSLAALRGRVRISVAAGGREAVGEAVVNPTHLTRDRLVIRRSHQTDPDTLAVGSTLTAAVLSAPLVTSLTDPGTEVVVTITELAPPPPLVLIGPPPSSTPSSRLELLWRQADATLIPTAGVSSADRASAARSRTVAVPFSTPLDQMPSAATALFGELAAAGARFAVLGQAHPASLALLAAGLPPAPVLWLGAVDGLGPADAAAWAVRDASVPVVLDGPAENLVRFLRPLAKSHPDRRVAVSDDAVDVGLGMEWTVCGAVAQVLSARGPERTTVVVAPPVARRRQVDLESVLQQMTGAGVSPRTLGEALQPLGVSRRQVYDLLQAERARSRGE
ncbi:MULTISPECIES: DUF371 domain-containing protein [Streptomyces]|uniref:DUF371 domain-containing protein n=1 Tax=Streptomyces TaxID=1883 RepID=UPI00367BDE6C